MKTNRIGMGETYIAPSIRVLFLKQMSLLQQYSTHEISDSCASFESMTNEEEWMSDDDTMW